MILFSAVCLGPKFNMMFESEIWLSNASVAPGILMNCIWDTTDLHIICRSNMEFQTGLG